MASIRVINVHRTWEDYLGMVLGALVVLSPAFAGPGISEAAMLNAGLVGVAVLALAAFELVDLHRWEESLELLCGLWLLASPFVLGYLGGALMVWHLALGTVICLLAILEIWQDWGLSEDELASHGH